MKGKAHLRGIRTPSMKKNLNKYHEAVSLPTSLPPCSNNGRCKNDMNINNYKNSISYDKREIKKVKIKQNTQNTSMITSTTSSSMFQLFKKMKPDGLSRTMNIKSRMYKILQYFGKLRPLRHNPHSLFKKMDKLISQSAVTS